MHVPIAGMAEEDDGKLAASRRISQEVQVFGKTCHRHASVLDDLHRALRRRQPGEDRTRGVPQRPDRLLVALPCAAAAPRAPWRRPLARPRRGPPRAPPLNPPRTRAAAPPPRRAPARPPGGPAPHHVEEGAVEQFADRWPRRDERPRSRRRSGRGAGTSTCIAERNAGIGIEAPRDLGHDAERSLGADEEVEQVTGRARRRGRSPMSSSGAGEVLADHRGRMRRQCEAPPSAAKRRAAAHAAGGLTTLEREPLCRPR